MSLAVNNFRRLWDNPSGIEENLNREIFFRKHFTLQSSLKDGRLFIGCDSDYIVYLDGRELSRGQFFDDPARKSIDTVELPELAIGEHVLAVYTYYIGSGFSTYAPNLPGLYIAIRGTDFALDGDETFLVHNNDAFRSGEMPKRTGQLCYTTEYDGRQAIDFAAVALDDSSWKKALALDPPADMIFQARPGGIRPEIKPFMGSKVVKHGNFDRLSNDDRPTAAIMQSDICMEITSRQDLEFPLRLQMPEHYGFAGLWFIADLGGETVGFVEFEITAPAGTLIDFAHGEHIVDGRVRIELQGRHFADRYICHEGLNRFQLPFRRIGGRFLEVHIFDQGESPVIVHKIGVRPWVLPLPEASAMQIGGAAWNELRRRSLITLQMCMHEHYEDCPWREQALYTYDSRHQMIFGYYLWGNYDFAAASLELVSLGQREDGHFRLCSPTRGKLVIPMFSLIWVVQIYEHWLYSGQTDLFERVRPAMDKFIAKRLEDLDEATQLYYPGDDSYWNFYEWADGEDYRSENRELTALYNLYFIEALEAYAKLLESVGEDGSSYCQVTDRIRKVLDKTFWDEKAQAYFTRCNCPEDVPNFHAHTNTLMLYSHTAPESRRQKVLEFLRTDQGVPMTLSSFPYLFWTLQDSDVRSREWLGEKLMECYGPMLVDYSDSLWERADGHEAFYFAGSLCHGWSCLPIYYLYGIILGVRPLAAGFKRFKVAPTPGKNASASGEVVTPAGKISVSFRLETDGTYTIDIKHPAGLEPLLETDGFPGKVTANIEAY